MNVDGCIDLVPFRDWLSPTSPLNGLGNSQTPQACVQVQVPIRSISPQDWAKASGLADHQAFPSCIYNGFGHLPQRVDFENSLHLVPVIPKEWGAAGSTTFTDAASKAGCCAEHG